jgi:hypothetical protein
MFTGTASPGLKERIRTLAHRRAFALLERDRNSRRVTAAMTQGYRARRRSTTKAEIHRFTGTGDSSLRYR